MEQLTDKQIYEMLEKNGEDEVSIEFGDCLCFIDNNLFQIIGKEKVKKYQLDEANECLSNNKEAFSKIGISKFVEVEPDPNDPDYLLWAVI